LLERIPGVILAESNLLPILGWGFVLIVMLFFAAAAVLRLRRWLKEDDDSDTGPGFTLSDLRRLHRDGKMTDEEFEKARGLMVAGAKAMAANLPDPLARPGGPAGQPARQPTPPGNSPGFSGERGGRIPPPPADGSTGRAEPH
jgi:hypothetical protein